MEPTVRYHLTPVRVAITKRDKSSLTNAGEDMEKEPFCTVGETKLKKPLREPIQRA